MRWVLLAVALCAGCDDRSGPVVNECDRPLKCGAGDGWRIITNDLGAETCQMFDGTRWRNNGSSIGVADDGSRSWGDGAMLAVSCAADGSTTLRQRSDDDGETWCTEVCVEPPQRCDLAYASRPACE